MPTTADSTAGDSVILELGATDGVKLAATYTSPGRPARRSFREIGQSMTVAAFADRMPPELIQLSADPTTPE